MKIIHLDTTTSTNDYIKQLAPEAGDEMTVVMAEHQTAGRGQGTNRWESEAGRNMLFSILVHPVWMPVDKQFLLSMAGALALKDTLDAYTEDITLKWPNDVYWRDRKISGTLIETSLGEGKIRNCVFGTGLNVNQECFVSDAPNPVSLRQILGREVDREEILAQVLDCFKCYYDQLRQGSYAKVSDRYHQALYRKDGVHAYRDAQGDFEATLVRVEDNGHLVLRDLQGRERRYAFKEVAFVLPQQ